MKIQFIFTYEHKEQDIVDRNFNNSLLHLNKNDFIIFATGSMTDEEKQTLVKISSCIHLQPNEHLTEPSWLMECNGKIWLDDLEQWRQKNNIASKVSQDLLNEFYSNS